MRILEGVGTFIQLAGLVARLCKMVGCFMVTVSDADLGFQHHKSELFKV